MALGERPGVFCCPQMPHIWANVCHHRSMDDVPLDFPGWHEPAPVSPSPDTGRGQTKITNVDAKLAGWTCEDQLSM